MRVALGGASSDAVEMAVNEIAEGTWMVLEDRVAGTAALAGYFASSADALSAWELLEPAMRALDVVAVPEVRELADEDWRDSYKAHFKSWRCGRMHWVPLWERETYVVPPGDAAVWLDPGMAFGTGNHETTRLCCERLVAFAEARGTNARVIDAGCGSGILALSAVRLGFRDVRGFDNDPEAVAVSVENAEINDLAGDVVFTVDDLESGLAGREVELVIANIQADVLVRFATRLVGAVAPGGVLVLSGILAGEIDTVRDAFAAARPGWMLESRTLGEWADLCGVSPG
ncbi:MAG TPA: 50S ribosomal protein L11 methyltransferase [Opitutaceae bacterium]|nr:50S ribosomal protein L11 methyltransferase [Opitutaceae bacterium]